MENIQTTSNFLSSMRSVVHGKIASFFFSVKQTIFSFTSESFKFICFLFRVFFLSDVFVLALLFSIWTILILLRTSFVTSLLLEWRMGGGLRILNQVGGRGGDEAQWAKIKVHGTGFLIKNFQRFVLSSYCPNSVNIWARKMFFFLSSANKVSTGPTCQKVYVSGWLLCISGLSSV